MKVEGRIKSTALLPDQPAQYISQPLQQNGTSVHSDKIPYLQTLHYSDVRACLHSILGKDFCHPS